jgi:energy-converting hydrogenase Eha subunit B
MASAGLLGGATDNALIACLGVIPGVVAALGAWVGARYVARKGAGQVTPLLSPMTTNPDGELVRLMAAGRPVR